MASEHFLSFAENRYSFAHESLFDYRASQVRFCTKGLNLIDLLVNDDQHLFLSQRR